MTQNAGTAFDTVAREPSAAHLWPVELQVLDDARASARPFTGDDMNAEDRAWSARVDAAVHGLDVVDPAALDAWMQAHAESPVPHEQEAELVAVWETHIRDVYGYGSHDQAEPAPVVVLIPTARDRADAAAIDQPAGDLRIVDAADSLAVEELGDPDEDGWS